MRPHRPVGRVRPSGGRRRLKISLLMKRRRTTIGGSVMLMRSGLGPTVRRSREFPSIKLQGAARPTCTSRRWRLSFPLFCAVLLMMPNTQGPGRRASDFAYTAARASASLRRRAGARPTRPSFSRVFRPHRNVVGARGEFAAVRAPLQNRPTWTLSGSVCQQLRSRDVLLSPTAFFVQHRCDDRTQQSALWLCKKCKVRVLLKAA